MDPRGLERVRELFFEQIEAGLHPGAALAVYRHGQLVLDLYGGLADQGAGRPVDENTMFVLYSSTKPVTAACLFILWERGQLDWDDRVADHWPEFAQSGKEDVTIAQVLTHRGGFPDSPSHMTWDRWSDWDAAVKAMEELRPDYPPGRVIAYHPRNFGWVIGELVRRIDGRPINRFVREEITRPLAINDLYIGLPEWMLDRVSKLHAMEDCDRRSQVDLYNHPEVHRTVQPAGGGISSARGLARFFAMMQMGGTLDGVTVMSPDTVSEGHVRPLRGHRPLAEPPRDSRDGPLPRRSPQRRPGQTRSPHLRTRRLGHFRWLGQPGQRPSGGLHNQRIPCRTHQYAEAGRHLSGRYRRLRVGFIQLRQKRLSTTGRRFGGTPSVPCGCPLVFSS